MKYFCRLAKLNKMKARLYLTILFCLLLNKSAFTQSKTIIGEATFELAMIEKQNYLFKLGYAKVKQNKIGRYYSKYYFDIGYANQNNFEYVIPSFTYNVITYFSKKRDFPLILDIRATDFIFNGHHDIRLAPVVYYSILSNNLNINYSYNIPLNNEEYGGKFGRFSLGIKIGLYPFYKKEFSRPMK